MSVPAPRRRSPAAPQPPQGGAPIPLLVLVVGVVVAGLGIGALASAYQQRMVGIPAVLATAAPLPATSPAVAATPAAPSVAPAVEPSPVPTPARTPAPVEPVATSSPTPAATAGPTATPPPSPAAAPSPAEKPAPTLAPSPASPAATGSAAAVSLVRRYLDALVAGNESAAYAAFGGIAGDRRPALLEQAFIDRDAQIGSVRVLRTDAGGSTVNAEVVSGRGSYVATFHVTTGPAGPAIDRHDYIKI